jgi:hypothetical protein
LSHCDHATGYQAQQDAHVDGLPDPTDAIGRAQLWMLRNDLRGYILLGEPVARLSQTLPQLNE